MKPIIKWPGGKSSELSQIADLFPDSYDRYVEPFFGGGAVYFFLEPKKALINDISENLMDFYRLIAERDEDFRSTMAAYAYLWKALQASVERDMGALLTVYRGVRDDACRREEAAARMDLYLRGLTKELEPAFHPWVYLDRALLSEEMSRTVSDKIVRTAAHEAKSGALSPEDLAANILTGFTSGLYMYFRGIDNDVQLGRVRFLTRAARIANFFFIREYCYGSMFRYNRAGEFNVPYGGISYNKKDLTGKLSEIFSEKTASLLSGAQIRSEDFDTFMDRAQLTERDFVFLDPPYDTTFSSYEGRAFDGSDQERLARRLKETGAQFILVIKNTELIRSLYSGTDFYIYSFDNKYLYNVKSRNDRKSEHLIITNIRKQEVLPL